MDRTGVCVWFSAKTPGCFVYGDSSLDKYTTVLRGTTLVVALRATNGSRTLPGFVCYDCHLLDMYRARQGSAMHATVIRRLARGASAMTRINWSPSTGNTSYVCTVVAAGWLPTLPPCVLHCRRRQQTGLGFEGTISDSEIAKVGCPCSGAPFLFEASAFPHRFLWHYTCRSVCLQAYVI